MLQKGKGATSNTESTKMAEVSADQCDPVANEECVNSIMKGAEITRGRCEVIKERRKGGYAYYAKE